MKRIFSLSLLPATFGNGSDEEKKPPPLHTPGQAEGVDEESERKRRDNDVLRRERPSQAEGEDPRDEADEVPPED